MGKIRILRFTVGILDTNCYLVYDEDTRKAVVIDPGGEVDEVRQWIDRLGLELELILATHGHFDHVIGVDPLRSLYRAKFALHPLDLDIMSSSMAWLRLWGLEPVPPPRPDLELYDGQKLRVGSIEIVVLHTPGHTPGSVVFYLPSEAVAFTGDTLFCGTVGRTDLPGGSEEQLASSLCKIFSTLPDETTVYPGHGPSTTIMRERRANAFVEDALRQCRS